MSMKHYHHCKRDSKLDLLQGGVELRGDLLVVVEYAHIFCLI